jgi:hypothetical protein
MPGKKIGLDCKLFRNTATYNTPTWNTISNVVDLNATDSATQGDVSSRASNFKKSRRGLRDLQFSFGLRYDSADDDHVYLRAAYANGVLIDLWAADGAAATNSAGPRAWVQVTEFGHDQPLEDGVLTNVVCRPSDDGTNTEDPTWFTHS